MMSPAQLGAWMAEHFTAEAFRLETLQTYEVASDGSDYRRYLDGAASWTPERKQPWLDRLTDEHARGLWRRRVRLVTRPVTPYTRYACEWGYAPNTAAGEDVRILDLGERELPDVGDAARSDWWLVRDRAGAMHAAAMVYDDDGGFLGARELPGAATAPLVQARDLLWTAAEPFPTWWGRHHELHRDRAHAA